MTGPSSLLVVADYPFVVVNGRPFAEVRWDERLARLYAPRFDRILLLGRLRPALIAPAGWFEVDVRHYEVLDGGDWSGVAGFLRNLPRLWRRLRAEWGRVAVVHLKLFYLTSLAAWWFNRGLPGGLRRPVATLLVGDASEAMLLRDDVVAWAPARRVASRAVAGTIRTIQKRVELAGYVAGFLADRFGTATRPSVISNESWLHEDQVLVHDRPAPRNPATILFVGRLVPRKRANLLLQAVARLAGMVRCVIVGDGPERGALERQARELGIADRVSFTGWLGLLSPRMLAAYDAADIFCLPSYAEGLPLVPLEAMARGVAVVATAVSGTPEVVRNEETGLLIPRDDLDALTGALRRYLDEPALWRRCVDGGYETARRNTFERQRGYLADRIKELAN